MLLAPLLLLLLLLLGATSSRALCHLRPRRSLRQGTVRRRRRRSLQPAHFGPGGTTDHSESVAVGRVGCVGVGSRQASLSSARRWPRLDRWTSTGCSVSCAAAAPDAQHWARPVGPPRPKICILASGGGGVPGGVTRLLALRAAAWARGSAPEASHRASPARRGVACRARPVSWTESAPAAAASSRGPPASCCRAALCRTARRARVPWRSAMRTCATVPILAA